jgi:glutamate formiminotransferase/formiminotetrahydrofolate cyclodeaminase
MVEMGANLTRARERYAAYWPEMEVVRDRAQQLRMQLVELVAEDGRAYAGVIEALRLPQDTDAGRMERQAALDAATLAAAGPPGRILAAAAELAELAAAVAERGNVNLVGDATTAAVIAESAGRAAAMLVEIDAGMSRAPGAVEALATARVDAVRAADARTRALSAADMRRPRGL